MRLVDVFMMLGVRILLVYVHRWNGLATLSFQLPSFTITTR